MTGTVTEFDDDAGLGVITADDDGGAYPFHCTAIADGCVHTCPIFARTRSHNTSSSVSRSNLVRVPATTPCARIGGLRRRHPVRDQPLIEALRRQRDDVDPHERVLEPAEFRARSPEGSLAIRT